ncbi:hypothetical protein [Streptomyces sp. MMG1121]|uniref:hypothetical protein n=1 Tax=Streptomyces sp. MMG1121 TaxID=1415544 RepID=UPI000AE3D1A7|nr:hypothetical protein [Streptomyces sp. MMG1121]
MTVPLWASLTTVRRPMRRRISASDPTVRILPSLPAAITWAGAPPWASVDTGPFSTTVATRAGERPVAARAAVAVPATASAPAPAADRNVRLRSEDSVKTYADLVKQGLLPQHITPALLIDADLAKKPQAAAEYLRDVRRRFAGPATLRLTTAKVFLDGVMEFPAQTAALLTPYPGAQGKPTDHRGDLCVSDRDYQTLVGAPDADGWHMHAHAIGHRYGDPRVPSPRPVRGLGTAPGASPVRDGLQNSGLLAPRQAAEGTLDEPARRGHGLPRHASQYHRRHPEHAKPRTGRTKRAASPSARSRRSVSRSSRSGLMDVPARAGRGPVAGGVRGVFDRQGHRAHP